MSRLQFVVFVSFTLAFGPGCGSGDGGSSTPPPPPRPSPDASLDAGIAPMSDASTMDAGDSGGDGGIPTVPDGGLIDCPPTQLLLTTSDFSVSQTATVQLTDGASRVGSQDGVDENFDADSLPVALMCGGAILERTTGRLRVLANDDPFTTAQIIDLNRFGDESSLCATDEDCACAPGAPSCGNSGICVTGRCSRSSAVLPTAAWQTDDGYVYLIGEKRNSVYVINPEVGGLDPSTDDIDLSPLLKPEDSDGSVDPVAGIMIGRRLYIALGNYWFDSEGTRRFSGSQLAVVDVPSRTLLIEETIELEGDNPWLQLVHLPDEEELWVVSTGSSATDDGLIEAVDLSARVSDRILFREDRLPGGLDGFVYIKSDITYILSAGNIYLWDPLTDSLAETSIATGISRGIYAYDGLLYGWGESGMRTFDAITGEETTGGPPVTLGFRPIYGAVAAP